jgi:putative SOS response-associated peptidase YedK
MCGRFKRTSWSHDWKAFYGVDHDELEDAQKPSFNIAPTQVIAVVRADDEGERHLVGMRWGLIPSWAKDKKIGNKLINARADGIVTKPSFRAAFKRRRCLVPMDAYYEWRDGPDGKVPYLVERADHAPLAAAGLWETWRDPATDEKIETTTIITTESPDALRTLHDRMPVFIAPERFGRWLAQDTPPEVAAQLLLPTADLVMRRVSKRLNNPRNDDPSVLEET